ncbi:MAG: YicC family protein [Deltaproteobacteria bacterium]|nr:YicC family protein [Deltaproteobacteria bacterium]
MIRSMTGFGAGRGQAQAEVVTVELRSVNAKFCEVKPRLPRELSSLEQDAVKRIKARIQRGSIDLSVRREGATGGRALLPKVDRALASAYVQALRELKTELALSGEPSVHDVAQLEGVISVEEAPPDPAACKEALEAALEQALDAHDKMRLKEGEALAKDLNARLDHIAAAGQKLRALSPQSIEAYRERLTARIAELSKGTPVDPQRLAQEVAFFADRVDVAEELTRLASHLEQLRALLAGEAPSGRRLEFLVQETNREVNTIGSKSQGAELSALVVEMKAELERIREQIQNIE